MSHLPECPCPTNEDDPWYCCSDCNPGVTPPWERACICDRLRACEQRVLDAARQAVKSEWTVDPSWDGTNWNNALYAATEAIDALRKEQK